MSKILTRKISGWIAYPILIFFSLAVVVLGVVFYVDQAMAGLPFVPFGGYLINTDYVTCNCGFIIFTVYDKRTDVPIRLVFPYVGQLVKMLLKLLGINVPIPVPSLYLFYNFFTPKVNVLGDYFPYTGAPCLKVIPLPPYCAVTSSGGAGYLRQMGTSLIPTN